MTERERADTWIAVLLVAGAAALRFSSITGLGLTHFDEGSYAMTGRWLASFGAEGWPFQPQHAPPLFASLVGASFLLFGVSDTAAIAVSAVAGSLTVGLIYLLGRAWFSRRSGLVAALFLATAEYHLVYSRMALTDATFTLLFWAALAALFEAVRSGDRRWTIAGGVLTGLCWNTKYHGFFPLVAVAAWLVWRAAARRADASSIRRSFSALAVAALVAAGLYLPWAVAVQAGGGYGELLRTHIEHSLGGTTWVRTPPAAFLFYLRSWLAAPLLAAALAGAAWIAARRDEAGLLVLSATGLVLASATLYMSFPRLILPVVPAVCLFAAYAVDALGRRVPAGRVVAALLAIAIAASGAGRVAGLLALRTDAYREAARYVAASGLPVVSQMSKNYYFYERLPSREMRFAPVAGLDAVLAASPEALVAVDPIVARLPEASAWVDRVRARATVERVFAIRMYEPVYYQGFDPTLGFDRVPRSTAPFVPGASEIVVYRVATAQ